VLPHISVRIFVATLCLFNVYQGGDSYMTFGTKMACGAPDGHAAKLPA